ncbi:MAG: hypothetical protein HY784_00625 [Chloroflexi bacterium]|nr:hypothetical protein [Chloroflexota bacterium]
MTPATTINRTELARRTRQIMEQARRGRTLIVESYGEEQVVVMDALDYRLLRSVATHGVDYTRGVSVETPASGQPGLTRADIEQTIAAAGGDSQAGWNRAMAAYLQAEISLGRTAELLELSPFELRERFNRLGLPLLLGPTTAEEALSELDALRQ